MEFQTDAIHLFITWTTYGTWLPGDMRGWRKWKSGEQQPQPLLEDWCRERMKDSPILLREQHRDAVEKVVREHCVRRDWQLHAVSARSNHVHVAVTVVPDIGNREFREGDGVKRVRDQLKANATRVLRQCSNPITKEKIWTKGGDIQFVNSDDDLQTVVTYILEAQDRMDRPK